MPSYAMRCNYPQPDGSPLAPMSQYLSSLHFICIKTVELIAGKTGMKAVISTAVSK